MKKVPSFGCRGFSLVEAIGGLVLFTLMMGALTYASASLFSFQGNPDIAYQAQTYHLAPSFEGFRQAVDLHSRFTQAVDAADNVLIFGGERSHPSLDPNGPSSALAENFADTTLMAAAGSDPFQAASSWGQREVNATQFEPYLTSDPDPADFTVLTVQGQSRITSITQQRRLVATVSGQALVFYEVTHQGFDWSSGSPVPVVNSFTGGTPTASYRIYYSAAEDTWTQRPGATHYWYRTDSAWDRDQEGPSRVIFADPYVLAGQDTRAQVTSVSRFAYFLAQAR